ncbi:30S ribosomal protein S4e [Candidatus Woesearchaeota archaeon CG10_big_fil_rev_8_21_14_0_10_45_16]|nr:MAG: 30S ribosomal protein S4e [Candidatus Woesearchaeota archaeon CG10_big_fil_rev_8_21_14_0_10_45_16]
MKNHLKRIASPRTWVLDRKETVFTVRPNAGAHSLNFGLALGTVLRDVLKLAQTMAEVKKMLHANEVLVDGRRRKDHRLIIGLFDVLAIPSLKQYHRVVFDKKGRLVLVAIKEEESTFKPCKITGKTVLPKGVLQFNLHDGRNVRATEKANVGDTLLISLPDQKVKKVLPLQEKASVFLTGGKHAGNFGVLKEVHGKEATFLAEGQDIETAKTHLFVVGDSKPLVTLS